MSQELDENGERNVFYKIFYQESRSNNASARIKKVKMKPTCDFLDFQGKAIKQDLDLGCLAPENMAIFSNERAFRENQVFSELAKAVDFVIGSDWKDPLIVLISARDAKRLRPVLMEDILPKPDSERLDEIFFRDNDIKKMRLPFVNRENSTAELLKILYGTFLDKYNPGRRTPEVPLVDTAFGSGKSRFAASFLGSVRRIMNEPLTIQQLPPETRELFSPVAAADKAREYLFLFQQEILRARTIVVDLTEDDAVETLGTTIRDRIVSILEKEWRISTAYLPPKLAEYLSKLVDMCPIFLVLDEIGKPFVAEGSSKRVQRERFLRFTRKYCPELTRMKGLHFLLCGKSPFLNTIGVRPSGLSESKLKSSPVSVKRVLLNPIREDKIGYMLGLANVGGVSLRTVLQKTHPNFSQYCIDLYAATSGNPRSVLNILMSDSKDPWQDVSVGLDIDAIMDFIREYSKDVKVLYDDFVTGKSVNLKDACREDSTKPASKAYIASRLMAGYERDESKTKIFFPPKIVAMLDVFLGRLSDFLSRYKDSELHINKGRVFEFLLLKLFQSVLMVGDAKSFANAMDGFIPTKSDAGALVFTLDVTMTDLVGRVMIKGSSESGNRSINFDALGKRILRHYDKGDFDCLVPGTESNSPDIFLFPHALNGSRTHAKHIIGVAAKCYSDSSVTSEPDIQEELDKFVVILKEVNRISQDESYSGSLLICSTHYAPGIIGKRTKKSWIYRKLPTISIEVIIVNIGTRELREKFFTLGFVGLPAKQNNEYLDIIENIINHQS